MSLVVKLARHMLAVGPRLPCKRQRLRRRHFMMVCWKQLP